MTKQISNGHFAQSLSHRKVKSGCQTCKRRRVKCDESRPACNRCETTGRTCDGYGIWGGGGRACGLQPNHISHRRVIDCQLSPAKSAQVTLLQPVRLVALQTVEKECFEWFMHRSAVKLPGLFASHHWTSLLFQASVSEPAIRHAILALSSAHKEEVRGSGSLARECDDEQTLFTVTQYSKAITCLQPCFMDSRRTSVHITLISCALFVSTELLRGHYTQGLLHLEHGLNLLVEHGVGVGDQGPLSTYVDGWVITILTRFLVQAKLLGQLPTSPCRRILRLGIEVNVETFRSIHHARRSLEHIMLRALDLQEQSSQLTAEMTGEYSKALLHCQSRTQTELRKWLQTYEATVTKLPPETTILERLAYHILQLYYDLAFILTGTCVETYNELRFDQYLSTFKKIISFCIDTHKFIHSPDGKRNPRAHHDPEPSSPNSVSDIGWIAPLYFTAVKCRNRRVRGQAIRLLGSSVHKEGVWNSGLAVVVARKVVEIEEKGFHDFGKWEEKVVEEKFGMLDDPVEEDLAVPTLPVHFRLNSISIVLPDDRAGMLLFRGSRMGCDGAAMWIGGTYDLRTRKWIDGTWLSQNKNLFAAVDE